MTPPPSTGTQRFQCPNCPKSLGSKRSFKQHQEWIHNDKLRTEVCSFCHKRFRSPAHLKEHMRAHTGERPNICNWCDSVSFSTYSGLVKHIRCRHTKERTFQCELCSKTFSQSSALKQHQLTHQNPKGPVEKLLCPMCSKPSGTPNILKLHIETHLGETTVSCHICSKIFKSKYILRVHVQRHGERQHSCSQCSKAFRTKGDLRRHFQDVHVAEELRRRFVCSICKKAFSNRSPFRLHVQGHKPPQKFLCPLCPKKLKTQSGLRSHIYAHTREKSFQFPACPKAFGVNSDLKSHLKRKHTSSPATQDDSKTEID